MCVYRGGGGGGEGGGWVGGLRRNVINLPRDKCAQRRYRRSALAFAQSNHFFPVHILDDSQKCEVSSCGER